jgi:fucose permease
MQKSQIYLFIFVLALYGLGAMISPLVATLLLQHGNSWKVMYICLGVFAFFNLIFITLGFWSVNFESGDDNSEENTEEGEDGNPVKLNHSQLTKAAIFNRMTLVGALYILLYVGDEVVPGGWGYTFLTEGRLGDKIEMGRVVSAYWAGLAIGRIALGYLTSRFGEKLMITLFTLLIICSFITMMVSSDIVINSTGIFFFHMDRML